eukprot:CAMPEP_0180313710 /NCGR_PEP_ID=MMETSP0988-20121125/31592_1 /TAXON_ID=697907 /ORGANISM="non described non described, Strain CCMP2293" /LENGTH=129 /DNA_ID=CAMNT_0022298203 /DNA_START=68 /DNA_END=453 /DNA_ORIENTATION=+
MGPVPFLLLILLSATRPPSPVDSSGREEHAVAGRPGSMAAVRAPPETDGASLSMPSAASTVGWTISPFSGAPLLSALRKEGGGLSPAALLLELVRYHDVAALALTRSLRGSRAEPHPTILMFAFVSDSV